MVLGGCCLAVIAVFFPPITVIIRRGCGVDLLVNIGLCLLGWIPGILHAWFVVLEYPSWRQRRKARKQRRSMVREEVYIPAGGRVRSRDPVVVRRSRSRSVSRRSMNASAPRTLSASAPRMSSASAPRMIMDAPPYEAPRYSYHAEEYYEPATRVYAPPARPRSKHY